MHIILCRDEIKASQTSIVCEACTAMYSAEESRQGKKKTQANTGSIGLIRVDLLICAYHIYWPSTEEANRDIAYS